MTANISHADKKVAIIGTGIAGLVNAKECIGQGLQPVMFEKTGRIGGLWNDDSDGHVWRGMQTNLSRHSCSFPNFEWDESQPLFPNQAEVLDYLNKFSNCFNLMSCCDFRFNSSVQNVSFNADGSYDVEVNGNVECFSKVIVATGFFSKPFVPEILQPLDNVTHSSNIEPFENYRGKEVVVVGNGFSGCDLAVALSKAGADVTHMYRHPYYVIPRMIAGDQSLDSVFYRYEEPTTLSAEEQSKQDHQDLSVFRDSQESIHPDLQVNSEGPLYATVSDGYLEAVKSGAIKLCKTDFVPDELKDCNIIAATGFKTNLDFLSDNICEKISYDPEDRFMPVLLHEGGWGRSLPNIAFAGMWRGPYFLTLSLQATGIAKAFTQPEVFYPSDEVINKAVSEALEMKKMMPRPQFPHNSYVQHSLRLSEGAGIDVSLTDRLGQTVLPQHFSGGPSR